MWCVAPQKRDSIKRDRKTHKITKIKYKLVKKQKLCIIGNLCPLIASFIFYDGTVCEDPPDGFHSGYDLQYTSTRGWNIHSQFKTPKAKTVDNGVWLVIKKGRVDRPWSGSVEEWADTY